MVFGYLELSQNTIPTWPFGPYADLFGYLSPQEPRTVAVALVEDVLRIHDDALQSATSLLATYPGGPSTSVLKKETLKPYHICSGLGT